MKIATWVGDMSTNVILLSALGFSTLMCLFSNSWLIIWTMMEINTLTFCSIANIESKWMKKNQKESMMNYLIIQSVASAILIATLTLKKVPFEKEILLSMFGISCLTMKMAAAPFHQWFIKTTKKLSWFNNLLIFSWQKMIPMFFMFFQKKMMLLPFIIVSAVVGSVFMINKKSMKEIMSFSSIFNLSWLLAAVTVSTKNLFVFISIYWTSLIFMITKLSLTQKVSITESNSSTKSKTFLFFSVMNLAGVPPFMMFMAKWYTLINMLKVDMKTLPTTLLVMSSISMYTYMRMTNIMNVKTSSKIQKTTMKLKNMLTTPFFLISLTPLILFT